MSEFDSREFYELCQTYRHTPLHEPAKTVDAFEAIKGFGKRAISDESKWHSIAIDLQGERNRLSEYAVALKDELIRLLDVVGEEDDASIRRVIEFHPAAPSLSLPAGPLTSDILLNTTKSGANEQGSAHEICSQSETDRFNAWWDGSPMRLTYSDGARTLGWAAWHAALESPQRCDSSAVAALRELVRQIDAFAEKNGEADFYVGDALKVLEAHRIGGDS